MQLVLPKAANLVSNVPRHTTARLDTSGCNTRPIHSAGFVNAIYAPDVGLHTTAATLVLAFKHSANSHVMSDSLFHPAGISRLAGNDTESFWRRFDIANKCFADKMPYNKILAESPNFSEVRRAHSTNCNQKRVLRPDRVHLISSVLKRLALDYWLEHIDAYTTLTKPGGGVQVFGKAIEYAGTSETH